jgi:hypothetical protein
MHTEAARVGSSAETAVVVRTLWAEYTWLQEHHPGVTVVSHREVYEGERLLDILTVESEGSAAREVYFDVSACFRDRRPTPPCPYCGEPLVTANAEQCRRCFADFHDPAHVIYRKGRGHVDRAREQSVHRRKGEASPPGLNDPRAAFSTQFRPTHATAEVCVLRFPDRLSALDERVFRIGVEWLIADGCRGVVCQVDQPMRQVGRSTMSKESEQLGLLLRRITEFPRFGVRVALVGGEELVKVLKVRILLENYQTEELAIARLTSELRSKDDRAV